MAISQVGNIVASCAKNGANVTLTFSETPAQNDVIYLCGGSFHRAGTTYGASGYTEIYLEQATRAFGVWRLVVGASPPSTVVGLGTGNGADTTCYAAVVLRGVDTSNPEDVTRTLATNTTGAPDPASITPTSNNCAIVIGAGSSVTDTTPGTVTGYTVGGAANLQDTNLYTVGIGVRILTGGGGNPEDPAAWSTWSTSTWRTVTVAVRPQLVTQTLTPSLFDDSTDTFYAPTVTPGAVNVAPSLFSDADSFYAPTVEAAAVGGGYIGTAYMAGGRLRYTRQQRAFPSAEIAPPIRAAAAAQDVQPSLFEDSDSFYVPTVSATYSIAPSLFEDADSFYAPTISATYSLQPGLFEDGDSFYAPTIAASYTIQPGLFDESVDTFYAPTVVVEGGPQEITPSLFVDADTFYAPTVSAPSGAVYIGTAYVGGGRLKYKRPALLQPSLTVVVRTPNDQTIAPNLSADGDTFYVPTVAPGAVDVSPSLYSDDDTFYAPTVFVGTTVAPSLFVDADTFYAPTIEPGAVNVGPSLYSDPDAFFSPTISGSVDVAPSLYVDADSFFAPVVTSIISPSLHSDPDDFFAPSISVGPVNVAPSLFVDADTFYVPVVSGGLNEQDVQPALFADPDLIFAPLVVNLAALVQPPGRWTAVASENRLYSNTAEIRATSGVAEDRTVETDEAEDRQA